MPDDNILWNLIYPAHCPVCHKILKNQKSCVCPACRERWRPVEEPRCYKCGKPLQREEEEYCMDCRKHHHAFEAGVGIFSYDREKKDSLMKYKFGGRREYAAYYGEACVTYGRKALLEWKPEGIIPIPLHPRKERLRGFNQAELVAEIIGNSLGIPVYRDCLKKETLTKAQKTLGARERRKNLQHVFSGTEGLWNLERVLLVDDVYTTGSTIDAAAEEILRHGVKKVYFLTIFIGKGF